MGERLLSSWFGGLASVVFSPPSLDRLLLFGGGMAFCFLLLPASCVQYVNLSYPFVPNIISFRRARGGKGAGASGENSRPPNVYCDANYGQVTWIVAAVYRDFFSRHHDLFSQRRVGLGSLPSTRKRPNTNSKQGKKEGCIRKGELFLALISHRLSRKKNTFGLPPTTRFFSFFSSLFPPSLVPLAPKFSQASRPPPLLAPKKGKRGKLPKSPMHARTHIPLLLLYLLGSACITRAGRGGGKGPPLLREDM